MTLHGWFHSRTRKPAQSSRTAWWEYMGSWVTIDDGCFKVLSFRIICYASNTKVWGPVFFFFFHFISPSSNGKLNDFIVSAHSKNFTVQNLKSIIIFSFFINNAKTSDGFNSDQLSPAYMLLLYRSLVPLYLILQIRHYCYYYVGFA